MPDRVHVIAAAALARDLQETAREICREFSFKFLPDGRHHSEPEKLRRRLQAAIDDASVANLGGILAIAYRPCGTGLAGLQARHVPLSIPRDQGTAGDLHHESAHLKDTQEILHKLLMARRSTPEILVVQPHHATVFDSVSSRLDAVPVWLATGPDFGRTHTLVFKEDSDSAVPDNQHSPRFGLGIDAGGTYTDAVIYDFSTQSVVSKAKALTTKWDYTIGIEEALSHLDSKLSGRVDLVAVSTTLATNAIVEGKGQKVGLLVMPPYGRFHPADVPHRPLEILQGIMEIDGTERVPVDPIQVGAAAASLVDRHAVGAFAVAGFAGHVNPSHELQVKEILCREYGLTVTCSHEVSSRVNYRMRAETAALNARIIPCLVTLIDHLGQSFAKYGISAPAMVVRSDGSLMSLQTARERPIETILSGPAASVAGARFLTGIRDGLVVDMGGTTTDTARVIRGIVQTKEEGATVGGRRTHVQALDMRTLGLGGDSCVVYEGLNLQVGPQRVAPLSWLAARAEGTSEALDWVSRYLDDFLCSTRRMDLICRNGHPETLALKTLEEKILQLLGERPHSIHELAQKTVGGAFLTLPLRRLEEHHLIQRCGLTPTDLLLVEKRMTLWDPQAAGRICELYSHLMGTDRQELAERVFRLMVNRLAVELLEKHLDGEAEVDEWEVSGVAKALLDSFLEGGNDDFRVRISLKHPVIGIGAPIHHFLPQAAKLLETKSVIPPNAEVANAIGAITSSIFITKEIQIVPNDLGGYTLQGIPEAPALPDFERAHQRALSILTETVRAAARRAGTSETRVEVEVSDQIAPVADGGQLFLGRTLTARLTGRPDVIRLAEPSV